MSLKTAVAACTTLSPRDALADALSCFTRAQAGAIAKKAGVTVRQAANAICGRPVETISYLRICTALEFDPLPEIPHPLLGEPSDFIFGLFGSAFAIRRRLQNLTHRNAGQAIASAAATVVRIERGDVMSIGVVLRACRWLDMHPYGYCTPCLPKVSRETRTETAVVQ